MVPSTREDPERQEPLSSTDAVDYYGRQMHQQLGQQQQLLHYPLQRCNQWQKQQQPSQEKKRQTNQVSYTVAKIHHPHPSCKKGGDEFKLRAVAQRFVLSTCLAVAAFFTIAATTGQILLGVDNIAWNAAVAGANELDGVLLNLSSAAAFQRHVRKATAIEPHQQQQEATMHVVMVTPTDKSISTGGGDSATPYVVAGDHHEDNNHGHDADDVSVAKVRQAGVGERAQDSAAGQDGVGERAQDGVDGENAAQEEAAAAAATAPPPRSSAVVHGVDGINDIDEDFRIAYNESFGFFGDIPSSDWVSLINDLASRVKQC